SSHLTTASPLLYATPRTPRSTLFPYTTLFRSPNLVDHIDPRSVPMIAKMPSLHRPRDDIGPERDNAMAPGVAHRRIDDPVRACRSEEHTSQFLSRENLVCRLLLEKKK